MTLGSGAWPGRSEVLGVSSRVREYRKVLSMDAISAPSGVAGAGFARGGASGRRSAVRGGRFGSLVAAGMRTAVGDLDIVPDLAADNLVGLCDSVRRLGLRSRRGAVAPVPAGGRRVVGGHRLRFARRPGRAGPGRTVDALRDRASPVRVADVDVIVASVDDAWALRRRFKTSAAAAGGGPR